MTVEEALRNMLHDGVSKAKAAAELNISGAELNAFLKEYGIDWPHSHHSTRPGVMPVRIGRSLARIKALEGEYGMPLAEILQEYASDGESINSTAQILMVPYSTFRRWPEVRAIEWKGSNESNSTKDLSGHHDGRRTPAIVMAAKNNLEKARATLLTISTADIKSPPPKDASNARATFPTRRCHPALRA